MSNKYVTMKGYLEYARVFEENMDTHEFHAETKGAYHINFYPESEEELDKYFGAGAPKVINGHEVLKVGDPDLGFGKFIKLKRPNHPRNTTPEFAAIIGGPPKVFNFIADPDGKSTLWSPEEDGLLGNGTKALVKVNIFKGAKAKGPRIRLDRIAVLEHVPYETSAYDEDTF